jgi:transposase
VEPPEAHPAGEPARRGGNRSLVRRTLAGTQKGAEAEGRTIVWVDQSGFYLLPTVVRTYAPVGQTPILRVPLSRDHLSVVSGITLDGSLYQMVQACAFRSPDVVRFLRHLLRHIKGKLLVIWDGAPIHRGEPVKAFLAEGGAERLHLEQLPGYAPDLNPDEGVWRHLKHVELRNVCCTDLGHLRSELRLAMMRLRHKPRIIQSCIRQAGYHA